MKPYLKPLLALVAFIGACVATTQAIRLYEPQAKDSKQPVVIARVIDGDTVVNGDGQTCRLAGIDAPELEFKGRWPEQDFAMAAKQYLIRRLEGQRLTAKYGKPDRYGRQLVTLYLADGTDVNSEMVECGLAWHYGRVYAAEQKRAQVPQPWGLWSDPHAVEPAKWRKGERAVVAQREDEE